MRNDLAEHIRQQNEQEAIIHAQRCQEAISRIKQLRQEQKQKQKEEEAHGRACLPE